MAGAGGIDAAGAFARLEARAAKVAGARPAALGVVFAAPHAAAAHEDLEAAHPGGGRAKFLESAARDLAPDAARFVAEEVRRGRTLAEALRAFAERVKAEARARCPVDTGELRDSAAVVG